MKTIFNITGMHCKSCEELLGEVLTDAGVKKVEVSHKNGKLIAEYDESNISEAKIKQLIENEGYKVKK